MKIKIQPKIKKYTKKNDPLIRALSVFREMRNMQHETGRALSFCKNNEERVVFIDLLKEYVLVAKLLNYPCHIYTIDRKES